MQLHDTSERAVGPPLQHDFGAFFTNAAESMVVLNANLRVVAANLAAREALALTEGADVSFAAMLAQDARRVTRLLDHAMRGVDLKTPSVVSLRRTDGAMFGAEITAARFDAEGTPLLGVVIHDRSESDAALEQLRHEQHLYETLFDLSPIPLREENFNSIAAWFTRLRRSGVTNIERHLESDPGEMIDAISGIKTVRVNKAMIELMAAKNLDDLANFRRDEMTAEVLESFRHEFITLWEGGTYHEAEFLGLDLAGKPFECRLTMSIQTKDGQLDLSRVIVALQDITEVRAYERTLEKLIAGKDRFVASISHELRTPLAAVLGLSQELYDLWDEFEKEEAQELMGLIARGANDLATLVEDLLLAGQIEAGNGVKSTPKDFDLHTEISHAIDDCMASGDVMARPTLTDTPVCCHADPIRVRQIVRNLVINAARYGGDHIEVLVSADPEPTIMIIDDGPGIPTKEWDRIFNPYEQGSGTESARGALGLGLAISKQLAEIMQGTLTYRFRDGKSAFVLTLPAARTGEPG